MSDFKFKDIGRLGTISVQEMSNKDKLYFRITKLYQNSEGAWLPSNKGVSIPLEQVKDLRGMLDKFISEHTDLIKDEGDSMSLTSDLSELGED